MISAKRIYVAGVRAIGRAGKAVGLLAWLERRDGLWARWARSLFAIYDINQMSTLDLPWWTFGAIGEVDAFLRQHAGARVFEYGSGASTIWLARRAGSIVSVEHDAGWIPVIASQLGGYSNICLRFVPPDSETCSDPAYASAKPGWHGRTFRDYVHAIDAEGGLFDLIVVDGRARTACLARAMSRLAPDGMIVFDNSHRSAYRKAIAASPLAVRVMWGLTACLPYPDETTLMRHMPARAI